MNKICPSLFLAMILSLASCTSVPITEDLSTSDGAFFVTDVTVNLNQMGDRELKAVEATFDLSGEGSNVKAVIHFLNGVSYPVSIAIDGFSASMDKGRICIPDTDVMAKVTLGKDEESSLYHISGEMKMQDENGHYSGSIILSGTSLGQNQIITFRSLSRQKSDYKAYYGAADIDLAVLGYMHFTNSSEHPVTLAILQAGDKAASSYSVASGETLDISCPNGGIMSFEQAISVTVTDAKGNTADAKQACSIDGQWTTHADVITQGPDAVVNEDGVFWTENGIWVQLTQSHIAYSYR